MRKEIDPAQWAKDHKKTFIDKMIEPYLGIVGNPPTAFFMAGLPGAGKTEFTQSLISRIDMKPLRLDMDEIAAQIDFYEPQSADKFRKGATILLENVFTTCINKRINFVMDGTFGGPKALQNINRCLKRGYFVRVIYLYQDPKIAWNFTRARERIEHRAIDIDGFVDSYFNVLRNLRVLLGLKLDNVGIDIVIKGVDNLISGYYGDVDAALFDKIVKQKYNKDSLKGYINE